MFSQRAIQEFKEAFGIMDADKVNTKNSKFFFIIFKSQFDSVSK